MSFLFQLAEFVLLSVVALDTLGFVAEIRKNAAKQDRRDFLRLCFTWVFFLVLRSFSCATCCLGYFGGLLRMLFFAAKVYISVPAIGGTETLYNVLIEQNLLKTYFLEAYNLVKAKIGCCKQD